MLGMVFTELLEMIEDKLSPELADAVLRDAAPGHGGAYTAVGYYPHAELMALVAALSRRTEQPVAALVQHFGRHLLGRFVTLFPQMFADQPDLFDFLASIHGRIHVEVHKLYRHAKLPTFEVLSRDARCMRLRYQSPRAMEALAQGLIEGAAEHYGERCQISWVPWSGPSDVHGAVFEIVRLDVDV